jgi:type I restriction enzyme S subunit
MQIKLSQILSSLESGGRPKGGASLDNKGIPSLGAEHLDSNGGFNFKSVKYIPEDYFNGLKNGIIEKENILIVKDGATTGKVSFVTEDFPFEKASVNEHVFLLKIDKSKAFPRFAFQYLKCPQGQRAIMRDFRGATVGGISRGFVDFVKFELPPLPDQLHIANLLSKAENLIAQRKESIRLLDEFLKSVFLEMFGDPVRNDKMWEQDKVISYTDCIVPGRDKPKSFTGNTPWFTTEDLNHKGFVTNSKKGLGLTDEEIKEVRARVIPAGSVLITCVGDLGVISICKENCVVNQQLHAFICKEEINNLFLMYSLSFQTNFMYKKATSTTVPYMNKTTCNSIPVIVPPIELQTQFAQIVEKTETLKTQYQQSLQELDNLYGSLSQKAFRGELSVNQLAKA